MESIGYTRKYYEHNKSIRHKKIHLNILSNPEIIYGLISKLCSHVLPE